MVTLDVNIIAAHLEALEETIISKLIERAQFRLNAPIYESGKSGFIGEEKRSLFQVRLWYHERMDAQFGRFCVPEERPFSQRLPSPNRTVNLPETPLCIEDVNAVNLTKQIITSYLDLVPRLCQEGDDGQYGSSVEHDVYAVQAISRRIHYGAFYVAESKYRKNPSDYQSAILARDTPALMSLLTRPEVEEKIIARVREKVRHAQATVNKEIRCIIDPEIVLQYYRDHIIPLTKEGEIRYLLNRSSVVDK